MTQDSTAIYWQNRYETEQTGWDTGAITPPLKDYFDHLKDKDIKILIPGSGNSYEAEYLYKKGFLNVFVLDIAVAPLQNLKRRVPDFPEENLLLEDFFSLSGQFDLIVEQTFFCAIDPALRAKYAIKCANLLKPGGKLAGLLFNTEFEKAGPPFGGSKQEYEAYFKPYFEFLHFENAYNSLSPRQGKELFIELKRLPVKA
jgi:methyl halide transferase